MTHFVDLDAQYESMRNEKDMSTIFRCMRCGYSLEIYDIATRIKDYSTAEWLAHKCDPDAAR